MVFADKFTIQAGKIDLLERVSFHEICHEILEFIGREARINVVSQVNTFQFHHFVEHLC